MPFGLYNAPQIFQRIMDNIFQKYQDCCFVYIDILVFSKIEKERIEQLNNIAEEIEK